jgi:outer membrane protein assembly factor BamD
MRSLIQRPDNSFIDVKSFMHTARQSLKNPVNFPTVQRRAQSNNSGNALRRSAVSFCLAVMLALTACSSDPEIDPEYVERPVEELYNKAADLAAEKNFKEAAVAFDEVERQHPYSSWATRAQLMAAYSYYKNQEYDQAVIAAERYIHLHPGNKDTPYAFYLMATSYYEQITDVGRDQQVTEFALRALSTVVQRYPETEYARDARLKIDLANNHLAGKEMEIGRFYLKRFQYSAAINRFRVVIQKYQTTSHVPEALHRLVEAYLSLGVTSEAIATSSVLTYNFPGSQWSIDSYALLTGEDLTPGEVQDSWISRTWKKVF